MKDRTIVVEIAESDFLAIIQLDTDAGQPPNIEYRIRRANSEPTRSPTDYAEMENGSQTKNEGGQAHTNLTGVFA